MFIGKKSHGKQVVIMYSAGTGVRPKEEKQEFLLKEFSVKDHDWPDLAEGNFVFFSVMENVLNHLSCRCSETDLGKTSSLIYLTNSHDRQVSKHPYNTRSCSLHTSDSRQTKRGKFLVVSMLCCYTICCYQMLAGRWYGLNLA